MASSEYKPEYKTVIQFLMIHRMTPYSTLKAVLEKASDGNDTDIDKAIQVLNETIQCLLQKIVTLPCEITGERMCVLITTADREDLRNYLTPIQTEYLHRVVNAILTSEDGFVGAIDAINLHTQLKKGRINCVDAENYLDVFVQKKLLMKDQGFYCLTALSIAELGPYISEHYEVENCLLCKTIVIVGVKCPKCEVGLHKHCFDNFKQGFKKQVKCPKCKNAWIEHIPEPVMSIDHHSTDSDD
ncbi:SMC5-SMC6 complex component Non-SMC element 1 [Rhodnius prolixus]|uniref:Non-structural maintenance of chromosomes element 1 homolog n=2 Tax=Rhodnius TaxID=13248 RepID=T1HB85_RHOPR